MGTNINAREAAFYKAVTDLQERAKSLMATYRRAERDIMSVHQTGWKDSHFKGLKNEFDRANEYLRPLKKFMDKATAYNKEQGKIIKKYNDLGSPRSRF